MFEKYWHKLFINFLEINNYVAHNRIISEIVNGNANSNVGGNINELQTFS